MSDLLDLRTVIATWQLGPCAEVRVGEHVTRYVRRGSGPSVVLLGADADSNPVWGPLVELLGTGYRLVIPQPPPDNADASAWLRGFIEGVGLSSFVLIAGGTLADAALELTMADELTVRQLVVLPSNGWTPNGPSSRVLWLSPDSLWPDSLRRIEAFMGVIGV